MKKFIVFMLIIGCLVSTFHFKSQTSPILSLKNIENVCFVNDKKFEYADIQNIESGNLVYNYCSLSTARKYLNELQKDCKGIQLYFDSLDFKEILKTLKAEIISQSEIEGIKILYCFTPYYDQAIFQDGKKINLQIALKEGKMIAGFPLILTGY